jgi:Spy/CpxP family protein refolding chaperone
MKLITIAFAAAALLAAVAVRAADDSDHPGKGPGGPGGPGGPRFEAPLIPAPLMTDLKLTDEQKPKVDAIASEFAKKRDKILADQKNDPAVIKLRDEMKAARDAKDREKMKSIREQLAPHEKPLLDLRKEYTDKVRTLLTDDQKKTLDEARDRMRDRMHNRRGPGDHEGAPPPPPPPDAPGKD